MILVGIAPARTVADENGYFELRGVPVGQHSLIAAFEKIGEEVMIVVNAVQETTVGVVQVPTDRDIE